MANPLGSYRQISATMDKLLAGPTPIPAEKHLLREQILELELRRLDTIKRLSDVELMQVAIDFTLRKVPQNLASYPMALRETTMPTTVADVEGALPKAGSRSEQLRASLAKKLEEWRNYS